MEYSVYILECADGTLYTGIAADVQRRLFEHNGANRKGARYTSARRPVRWYTRLALNRAPLP